MSRPTIPPLTEAQVQAAYDVLNPYIGCGCCAEKEWPEQPDGQDALKVLLREALEAAAEVTG